MTNRDLVFEKDALNELKSWIITDKKIAIRIIELCEQSLKEPFRGIGKPEPLRHNRQGYWSRRINKEHRLVYKVTNDAIIIINCKYHY
jgi:toxin YoeB